MEPTARSDPAAADVRGEDGVVPVLRGMNGHAWGIALGFVLGGGLFAATSFLLLKGGPDVGQHLALLGAYLPGYGVSLGGSLVGFLYLFAIGYGLGRLLAGVYNRLVGS